MARLFTLLCSFFIVVCLPAKAEKLIVGVDSWPPFRFVTPENVWGIDHELWNKLSDRMGFEVEYLRCPWKRCLKMMENGQIDAMSGLAWRKERAVYITYTSPNYYRCSTQLYLLQGRSRRVEKHQDLHSMTVGMVGGSAYYEAFDNDPHIVKKSVKQEAVLPDLLLEGRIDSFIGTDCQADFELQTRGLQAQIDKAVFKPSNSVDLFVGLSSRSKWLQRLDDFNRELQRLRNEHFDTQALNLISPFTRDKN